MSIYKIGLILLIVVILAGGACYLRIQGESFQDCRDVADYYQAKYRYQVGNIKGFGHFSLVSLDGGKNWYAFAENEKNGEVKILGAAEEKFPGLLRYLGEK
ncbi:hypothetical protein HYT92_00590 [Candidatus Pacearchaeota archaeon]|nr:hypothetical protein [Candidatus Pacearchaeota archaeon]